MKITALVENRSDSAVKSKHGLSLYIETPNNKILFDVGPDETLFDNSETLGIDLMETDTLIISHAHYDHGGALEQFLKYNHSAKVYVQRKAFDEYYSKTLFKKKSIGLDPQLKSNPRVVLLDGGYTINEELILFTTPNIDKYKSGANKTLYSKAGRDDFSHEHSLMIMGDTKVLIMGCGHAGVVNILEQAAVYSPEVCVGGFHLWNPTTEKTVPGKLLDGIAQELIKTNIRYYTCHCTGQEAYQYLSQRLPNMNYLSCGETIEV